MNTVHLRAPLQSVARFLPVTMDALYHGRRLGRYKFLVRRDRLDRPSQSLWVDVPSLEDYLSTWPPLARKGKIDLAAIKEAATS